MLNDLNVRKLKNLIKDSFRVRPNHDPIYIDVSDSLDRLKSKQHQVFFGRRGSGKSCLFVHFKNSEAPHLNVLTIYIDTDGIKRLDYPDVLIRLLLNVMESMPSAKDWWRTIFNFTKNKVQKQIDELRNLLDQAATQAVTQENTKTTDIEGSGKYIVEAKAKKSTTSGKTRTFQESKLETLERHLNDYKQCLVDELNTSKYSAVYIILDDYYLIKRSRQPDVIDYLHRLFRGTDFYLKVGTIKHRTVLKRDDQQTIGIELRQDLEEINLDRTLEDLQGCSDYLSKILNSMGDHVGLSNASTALFNQHGFEKLVIASGGVPRDFLTIFVDSIDVALASRKDKHITPTNVWKAASSLSYQIKLKNLREDVNANTDALERVFRDLLIFCLAEKKKTCFLISQEEAQSNPDTHELILQLMDFKLIHVVQPDTSAASGRTGRFECYTLDFSLFMEPRRRNITTIEFWKFDESQRRIGVREAPVYDLTRAKKAINTNDNLSTEQLINQQKSEVLEEEIGVSDDE